MSIMKHPWFKDINWENVYEKKYAPTWLPDITSNIDTKYFMANF